MKKFLAIGLLAVCNASFAAEECGEVTIADMNWSSATLIANIDRFILEHGYGCDASLISGDTMPTGTSMIEKGEPDIAPEFWNNNLKEAVDKGVAEKRLRYAGDSLSEGGEEGLWVPAYMVEKDPSLATIEGIKKNAALFEHPEDPSVGAVYGCPAGWGCQITIRNLFEALEMEEANYELVDPGSGAGLAGSIAKAYERGEAWLGYYWAPTAILGKYKMVKVDFGTGYDQEEFTNCTTQEDCENPKVTMFPPSPVKTITTEAFAVKSPLVFDYLGKRSFTNSQMSELLAWMKDNQADGEIGMEHFLVEYESVWRAWLSPEVADKVKAAL